MRLRYIHRKSLSAARVGPRTNVILALHKRLPRITTQQYCIAETMDLLTNALNNVPAELQECCDRNLLELHPEKCKAMIIKRKSTFTGPIQALRLGNNILKWTTSEKLLGVQVDNKLPWSDHAANVAKSFASKLSLLRRMP